MIPQFDHQIFSSFYLWFNNFLLNKSSGFFTQNPGVFYPTSDPIINGYTPYSSPYKQFVYDGSVSGATIITGAYISGQNNLLNSGSGLLVDYINGRLLWNGSQVPGFTGIYSNVEYSIYSPAVNSETFILESILGLNEDLNVNQNTGIAPFPYAAPAAILSIDASTNKGFSFGGEDSTEHTCRAIIISKDRWGAEGVNSIFRDSNLLYFPLITNSNDLPLNFYNSLKTGNYNYNNLINKYNDPNYWVWIKSCESSSVSEERNKTRTLFLSYIEFNFVTVRFPRQPQTY